MADQERKLDETIPGGYFIGTDGKPHDAEGKPIAEAKDAAVETPPADPNVGSARTPANPPLSRSELEAMDKADLQALADQRGLTVEGSGSNGNVLKSDLVDALAVTE